MRRDSDPSAPLRKEDYLINARLSWEGVEIEKDLKCRVYLPIKLTDPIELHFFPTEQQAKKLTGYVLWQYAVDGVITAQSGEVMMQFSASEVFANRGVGISYYGKDFAEAKMVGYPVYFTITHLVNGTRTQSEPASSEVRFWITPNYLLEPATMLKRWHTGKVEAETVWRCELETEPGIILKFDQRYKYRDNDEGDTVSFSELVANATVPHTADSAKIFERLNMVNGVLLLASFAARRRSVCLGWDAEDSKRYVQQYVRNRSIPSTSDSSRDYRELLIEKSEFQEFMRTAYASFGKFTPQDLLRRAISLTVPLKDGTVEGKFVSLYTALEMLVLHFRRVNSLEFILPSNEFKKLRKELKAYIDSMAVPADRDKKSLIQQKLSELNRVSFGAAFEAFCKHYSVKLDDLWPVVKSNSGAALADIRNKLVHGEHFGPDHYEALMFAELHLRWTVERMILAVLNWDFEKSNVSPWFLSSWIAYKEWRTTQPAVS